MLVIKDFATTILASALTAAATSVVVSDAGRLPALSAGDYYYLVLQKFTDRTSVEVVKVTAASGNTLTVSRGQAGTSAKSFSIGDYAEQRITVATFSEYIAQAAAGKVDKSGAVVEQSLSFLNTGDLVSAGVGIAYEASRHVTSLGGGVGANAVNPFVALRPLGKDDSSVQAIYDFNGNFALLGGERKAEIGKLVSLTPADAFGWPNSIANDANNYSTRFRQKVSAGNNAIYIFGDGATNARRFGIQSGHESPAYANIYGILDLNPFGGTVRVNGGTVYHTNYVPTPAAVGALPISGGILTGALSQNIGGYGAHFFVAAGKTYLGGGKIDGSAADQKMVLSGFNAVPLTFFDISTVSHGVATVNGARLYTERYLPTPDVLGCVPQARTINTKPLTANITLSAADVGALPFDAATGVASASFLVNLGASADSMIGLTRGDNSIRLYANATSHGLFGYTSAGGRNLIRRVYADSRLEIGSSAHETSFLGNKFSFNLAAVNFSPAQGGNHINLGGAPNPSGANARGILGWDSTFSTREWGVGIYHAAGVAQFAYLGFGTNPWDTGLRVYGISDLRAGANRLYHEGYLPTPAVLGAVAAADNTYWHGRGQKADLNTADNARPGYFSAVPASVGIPVAGIYGHGLTVGPGNDAGVGVWYSQILFGHNNRIYTRNGVNGAAAGAWNYIFTSVDKPTAADVAALPYVAATNKAAVPGLWIDNGAGADVFLGVLRDSNAFQMYANSQGVGLYSSFAGDMAGSPLLRYLDDGRLTVGVSGYKTTVVGSDVRLSVAGVEKIPAGGDPRADSANGVELFTIAAPAGATAGTWYPVMVPVLATGDFISINTATAPGSAPMYNCSFNGYVRAKGWSDGGSGIDGVFTQYDTAEKAIFNCMTPTESGNVVVFYVEARAFPVTIRRTAGAITGVPSTGASVTHGTAVFNASTTPGNGSGTKISTLVTFSRGSGQYSNWIDKTQLANIVYDGDSGTGGTLTIMLDNGVYAIEAYHGDGGAYRSTYVLVVNRAARACRSTANGPSTEAWRRMSYAPSTNSLVYDGTSTTKNIYKIVKLVTL